MARSEFGIADAMKVALWEEAKGKLRALVGVQGSYHSGNPPGDPSAEMIRFSRLSALVEEFIERVEDDGLQE
jgi:hypothetical protein